MEMPSAAPSLQSVVPPVHVAVIMDGNGRWAKARGLPRGAGHKAGADAVRRTVEEARRLGISYLTLYAFSSENWKRPEGEITDLMGLLRLYLRNELKNLHKNNIRLKVIGDRSRLGADIVQLIQDSEKLTESNTALTLVLALSYGARQELLEAARTLARDVVAGTLDVDHITEDDLAKRLSTAEIPDPDLLIRTSGEQRISNFLLWQCAYAELVFQDVLWPDFGAEDLRAAISDFQRRERRFGASTG